MIRPYNSSTPYSPLPTPFPYCLLPSPYLTAKRYMIVF